MLERLGFRRGRVVECIATTLGEHEPNAAPAGAYLLTPSRAVMKLHTRTRTFANLMQRGRVVLNITTDPLHFLRALVAKEELELGTTPSGMPYLRDALAYAELELLDVRTYTLRDELGESRVGVVRLRAEDVRVLAPPQGLSRGACAVVELAVGLSRGRPPEERVLRVARRCLSAREMREVERLLRLARRT